MNSDNDPNMNSTRTHASPFLGFYESPVQGLYSDTESAALEYLDQQRDEQAEAITGFEDIMNMDTAAINMIVESKNGNATAAAGRRDFLKTPERLGSSGGTSPKEIEPSVTMHAERHHAVTGADQQVMIDEPQDETDYPPYDPYSESAVPEMIEMHCPEQCEAVPNETCLAPTPGPSKTPNRKRTVKTSNNVKKSDNKYTTTARPYNFKNEVMTPQEREKRFKNSQACRKHRQNEKLRKAEKETLLQQLTDKCDRLEAENTRLKTENKKINALIAQLNMTYN